MVDVREACGVFEVGKANRSTQWSGQLLAGVARKAMQHLGTSH